jgi:threonine dehydrogenase-like Zn-dependent dehydrogenase
MKGIVFEGNRTMRVETVPDPTIVEPGDVIVKVTKAGICGSDLHIYNHGEAFGFDHGCRIGHEFVGVVEAVGGDVTHFAVGDKVMAPFWISCGDCHFCRKGLQTSCQHGGCFGFQAFWPGGGVVQGGQSEYVRVPMAEGTLDHVPESLADDANDHRLLPMTDVFPTAYHAVRCAGVQEGDHVVVVGDGAVGLLAAHSARLFDPASVTLLGHHQDRLEVGARLGATHTVDTTAGDAAEVIAELTDGLGPDRVVLAISSPETMRFAMEHVQPGGSMSYVGMEVFLGAPDIPWDQAFLKNVTISGGVAPVRRYLPELWPLLEAGRIDPSPVLTHDLPLEQGAAGYDVMVSRQEGSVKVALSPGS